MSNDPKNPAVGELVIDASELASFIVGLTPGLQETKLERTRLGGDGSRADPPRSS